MIQYDNLRKKGGIYHEAMVCINFRIIILLSACGQKYDKESDEVTS